MLERCLQEAVASAKKGTNGAPDSMSNSNIKELTAYMFFSLPAAAKMANHFPLNAM
jgi:hypothetical protein